MPPHKLKSGRRQLLIIAAAFLVPLLLASGMYYSGIGVPSGTGTQHGLLLEPILHLPDSLQAEDQLDLSGQHWLMVYADAGICGQPCKDALYKLRQMRLMLGNDMNRVERLFLHAEAAPDTVFLEQQHRGLKHSNKPDLIELLNSRKPPGATAGGIYLIDPLGNLVMYFPQELLPREMLDDVKHLLELSRIG
jgi:hypothetical protein